MFVWKLGEFLLLSAILGTEQTPGVYREKKKVKEKRVEERGDSNM